MKNEVTRKVLVNVDPQVDFTTGILANKNAVRVIPAIRGKICPSCTPKKARKDGRSFRNS